MPAAAAWVREAPRLAPEARAAASPRLASMLPLAETVARAERLSARVARTAVQAAPAQAVRLWVAQRDREAAACEQAVDPAAFLPRGRAAQRLAVSAVRRIESTLTLLAGRVAPPPWTAAPRPEGAAEWTPRRSMVRSSRAARRGSGPATDPSPRQAGMLMHARAESVRRLPRLRLCSRNLHDALSGERVRRLHAGLRPVGLHRNGLAGQKSAAVSRPARGASSDVGGLRYRVGP